MRVGGRARERWNVMATPKQIPVTGSTYGVAGANTMVGGAGDDTFLVDVAADAVREAVNSGTDTVRSSVNYTLQANLERLILTGSGHLRATGNAGSNELVGNAGNNALDGGAGADTMSGGAGNDSYFVDSVGDRVLEAVGAGTDAVFSSISYRLGANLEQLTLLGTGSTTATGNGLDNALSGNAGHNVLDGGAGDDTMAGGAGNDAYYVDSSGDQVREAAGRGVDSIYSAVSYTLGADLERLVLLGGASTATGNGLGNALTGNTGHNTLDGAAGADTMAGGAGNDWYFVDAPGDRILEAAGAGIDVVFSAISYTLAAEVERLTLSGTDDTSAAGNGLKNLLTGNAGNNTLDGGGGADTLSGGKGSDLYLVESAGDRITETAEGGYDTVQSSTSWTLAANLERLILTGSGDLVGTGNDLANVLIGNSGNNTLAGGTGADTLSGGAGDDTYIVESAADRVDEAASGGSDEVRSSATFYRLRPNVENLTLTGSADIGGAGNALSNLLRGNSGANVLDGGAGADTMSAAAGDDTYYVDNLGDLVLEAADGGTDWVRLAGGTYTLAANVENLEAWGDNLYIVATGNSVDNAMFGGSGADGLYGEAGDDALDGGGGDDTVDGGGGSDTLVGGAGVDVLHGGEGDDTYLVDNENDDVEESPSSGHDTVLATVTYALAENVEDLVLQGTGQIGGGGNSLDNHLFGNSARNVLDGGAGADTMAGGDGGDVYIVDDEGDVVSEEGGSGYDAVWVTANHTMAAGVEWLHVLGTNTSTAATAVAAVGNDLDNRMYGLRGDDSFDGGSGADTMSGSGGSDRYVVDNAGDEVEEFAEYGVDSVLSWVDYALTANVENLLLLGTDDLSATGNDLANVLTGNSGNNSLDGGAGADTMAGGLGDDRYVVDSDADLIVESPDAGIDTVLSARSYALAANLEQMVLLGSDDLSATGNDLANVLSGNAGHNTLNGGAGADTLYGGAGKDTYLVENVDDRVVEAAGGGLDEVRSSATFHRLRPNVENLTLTGSGDIDGAGNALDNLLAGNSGANLLDGGAGADTMYGGAGDDTYVVDNENDRAIEESSSFGHDTVLATASYQLGEGYIEDLVLQGTAQIDGVGNGLDNRIVGNSAANVLDGGAGADTMAGGDGDDVYMVDNAGDVVSEEGGSGHDVVWAAANHTMAAGVEDLHVWGAYTAVAAVGNDLGNKMYGFVGDDSFDGGAGADTMAGGTGDDQYLVDDGGDIIEELAEAGVDSVRSSVSYALAANVENLLLLGTGDLSATGNDRSNVLTGNAGDNALNGGVGADTLYGAAGHDSYLVDNVGDVVSEEGGAGVDTVLSSIDYELGSDLENLTLLGAMGLVGGGNERNNVLTGSAGDDSLDGGAGADRMAGGLGDDQYVIDSDADLIVESPEAGVDTVFSALSYALADNLERMLLLGSDDLSATGNDLANALVGNAGNNTLDGGAGADTLYGGAGDDTFLVDDTADLTAEMGPDDGFDLVLSTTSYVLMPWTENLTLLGTAAINGIGNEVANVITGNDSANFLFGAGGDDTLAGGGGADTLVGGEGDDEYLVEDSGDIVSEDGGTGTDHVYSSVDFQLAGGIEQLTLLGSANLVGEGNDLANLLTGNSADNTLYGGAGADTMAGGTGDDEYRVDDAGDVVVEEAGAGFDVIETTVSYVLGEGVEVEGILLSGSSALSATGNAFDNRLLGNGGANTLDGGAGADILKGDFGDDLYFVDDRHDSVLEESAAGGADTVISTDRYQLSANTENLILQGSDAIEGFGNGLANVIAGNAADNYLAGGGGNDTLLGGELDEFHGDAGDDLIRVDTAYHFLVDGGSGYDTVRIEASDFLLENFLFSGVEAIDITAPGENSVVIDSNYATNLSAHAETLRIDGDGDDQVLAEGGFVLTGTNTIDGALYDRYVLGQAVLLVDADILVVAP